MANEDGKIILEFREVVKNVLAEAFPGEVWEKRFAVTNTIVEAAIVYGAKFSGQMLRDIWGEKR